MKALLLLVPLFALAASPRADLLQGRVVDSFGVGIPGVDIDVKNLGSGGTPDIFNDGTDINGFFSTTMPAGIYRVSFTPPPPPASTSLILEVEDVVVVGTTNMGVVALDPGVALSGRLIGPNSFPVAGVNLDVVDLASGDALLLVGDVSDVFGQFSIAVPAAEIELRFNTAPVTLQTLAPHSLKLSPTASTNLGDIVLQPGFHITGSVRKPGGAAVQNADVDVFDSATAIKIYTPGDNTNNLGNFDVVVPAGTWDVGICPQFSNLLVAVEFDSVAVAGNVSLGIIDLVTGFVLSGNVKSWTGAAVSGADLDVTFSATGASVALCADNTAANGNYSVIVPAGTLDVRMEPPGFSQPLGAQIHSNVLVTGNKVLNGTLPQCEFHTLYGAGSPGTGGFVPAFTTSGGAPRIGNSGYTYELSNGVGGGLAFVALGFAPSALPLFGGTLLLDITLPVLSFPLVLDGAVGVGGVGAGSLPFPFQVDDQVVGITVYCQGMTVDPANIDAFNPFGVTFSNALSFTFCN